MMLLLKRGALAAVLLLFGLLPASTGARRNATSRRCAVSPSL